MVRVFPAAFRGCSQAPWDQRLELREFWSCLGDCSVFSGLLPGHFQSGEEIEGFVLVDQVSAFGMQPHEMRAVFPAVAADAVIDAKEICVGTVDAFA